MPFSQRYLARKVNNSVRAINMSGEMSLVLPHLYLGSLKDRTNTSLMMKNEIKRVLCVIDLPDIIIDKGEYKPTHVMNIQAADAEEQDLAQYFEKCIEFIHQARTDHENILVHCQAGISRSATIVLAYLMTIGDYDVEKALQIVKGARGFIHPNPGFLSQLKRYHSNDVKKNWYRLTRRYQTYSFDDNDQHFVKGSLDVYWQQFEPAFIAEPVFWPTRKEDSKEISGVPCERKMICSSPTQGNLQNIRCNLLHQNCTFAPHNISSDSLTASTTYFQNNSSRTTPRTRTSSRPFLSTTRQRYTTKSDSLSDFDAFSDNLKRAALILAGIALGLGVLRVCLMLCKSRSPNHTFSSRHSATVRPDIATIEHHQCKPDLPPEYAEAIANSERSNGGKLPSYDELPHEQIQEQYVYNNGGFVSTQIQRNIPTLPLPFFFGHLNTIWNVSSYHRQLTNWTEQYGKIYGLYEGNNPLFIVSEPDFLQEGFIKQFTIFHAQKKTVLDNMSHDSVFSSVSLGKNWLYTSAQLLPQILNILANLFDLNNSVRLFLNTRILPLISLKLQVRELPMPWLTNRLHTIVEHRQQITTSRFDLLQLMFQVMSKEPVKDIANDSKANYRLTEKEVTGNIFAFMAVGYETTATALACATYVFATHPDILEKIQVEISQLLLSTDDSDDEMKKYPDYDVVAQMHYMDMFISEVLRMYHIVPRIIQKRATEDTIVQGIKIDKDSIIQTDVYSIHYDLEFWSPDDPYVFVLERHEKKHHPMAYLSFGAGPQHSVDMRFA
ncbi:unnamed protein product [Adineta ricciae]|uniref:Protein-tyrosine-phosphatase n=1 Tax=Adineta ricciae TaxID=249248 RepID=A0A813U3T9_ADIRI|nr:unnamed protein product [Adineta ricciae]